ncbi:MAG: hypothetical protein J6N76_10320 [Lachnospiraceae bacterium]|nr:hypothetical protein [Lachnospiraceae bacterium]
MYDEIGGIFTMKERIRATVATAGLALFLLAACGAQDAIDGVSGEAKEASSDIGFLDESSDESTSDKETQELSEVRKEIEQPLPDEDISDIRVIIKETSEIEGEDTAQQTENAPEGENIPKTETAAADTAAPAETASEDKNTNVTETDGATVIETDTKKEDWFASTGKTVTLNGKFKLTTMATSDDFSEDLEEVSVDCNMDITSVPSEKEGYITVIATLMLECDKGLVWEMIPFDRYTGVAMAVHHLGNGKSESNGEVLVNDKAYEVSYTAEIGRGSDGRASSVYRVTIPKEYDGLIFYVGYADSKIAAEDDKYLGKPVPLEEMPSWGSKSEFFFKL